MTPLVGDLIESTVGKVVGALVDKYLPKSMGEAEKANFVQEAQRLSVATYKAESKDIQSARAMQSAILVDAPRWIKAAAAIVVPYGGLMGRSLLRSASRPILLSANAIVEDERSSSEP